MKILIIFTGGTIGSLAHEGIMSPDDSAKYLLVENYKKVSDHMPDFEYAVPYTVLSENLAARNINALIESVGENIRKGYDGIIVTHGTDTLQYTSCALEAAFSDIDMPLIVVSANHPLNDERSNGNVNFVAAVGFIEAAAGKGVFTVYTNGDGIPRFHTPHFMPAHPEYSDEIKSIKNNEYAFWDGKHIILSPEYKNDDFVYGDGFTLCDEPGILVVSPYPGERYDIIDTSSVNAVIFRPYHSGTLNTADAGFVAFCEELVRRHIPAFVPDIEKGNIYESAACYSDLGITPLADTLFIPAYMKIWIAVSKNADIRSVFN